MIRRYWITLLLMMAVAAHGQMDSTVINLKNVVVTGKAGTKSVTAERTRINPSATMTSNLSAATRATLAMPANILLRIINNKGINRQTSMEIISYL